MSDKVTSETPVEVVDEVPKEIAQPPKDTPVVETNLQDEKVAHRAAVEQKVVEDNAKFPEPEVSEEEKPKEETPKEESPKEPEGKETLDKVKERVQKRINKLTAQKKTAEEEVAELRAEVERLKAGGASKDVKSEEKREPTDAEIRLALKAAREEGNIDLEAQILEYMTERRANRIADERISKLQEEQRTANQASQKMQVDWVNLNKDYAVYDDSGKLDASHPLNLSNQSGLLYTTALSLYQDAELHKEFYSDPDRVQGFRRAVADAYREIVQQGLYKPKPKETIETTPKAPRKPQLIEPDATTPEESPSSPEILSDADKVREEIKHRRKSPIFRQPS